MPLEPGQSVVAVNLAAGVLVVVALADIYVLNELVGEPDEDVDEVLGEGDALNDG